MWKTILNTGGKVNLDLNYSWAFKLLKAIVISTYSTGWLLKTVDFIFSNRPKKSISAITQWFLKSLYGEVLVFWCIKTVLCVLNFAFRSFSNIEHLLHPTRPEHSLGKPSFRKSAVFFNIVNALLLKFLQKNSQRSFEQCSKKLHFS